MKTEAKIPFADQGTLIEAPSGACIFQPGARSEAFLIVQSGTVRVEQTNQAGRTMVLYRVLPGETCVLTTCCLLNGQPYSGFGYAEGDVVASAIPHERFKSLLAEDADFRQLVFGAFAERVGELTSAIDDLLLHRTDLRLARWLAEQKSDQHHVSHEEVAHEVGTVREVVSRSLKSFEKQGWVRLARNEITLLDRSALRQHAQGPM